MRRQVGVSWGISALVLVLSAGCGGGTAGTDPSGGLDIPAEGPEAHLDDEGLLADAIDREADLAEDAAPDAAPEVSSDDSPGETDGVPDAPSDTPVSPDTVSRDALPDSLDAPSEVADAPSACPPWPDPRVAGNLDDTNLGEASGLAASRRHPGVLWSHNDSGDAARVFAIRLPGLSPEAPAGGATLVTAFPLLGITTTDAEDIALGPFPGIEGDALFLADTGNNGGGRQVFPLYVFPEPADLDGAPVADVRRIDVAYPDGTHDCESLFVDPWTGDLYLVVKEYTLPDTKVFRLSAAAAAGPPADGVAHVLEEVGRFPFQVATGADMSPDGRMLAIRGYVDGRLFRREAGQTVAEMLASEPCNLPSFLEEPYNEPQGEAVAFSPDGKGLYTVSERLIFPQDVHFTDIPDLASRP